MHQKPFPVIDMVETGKNIMRLREERGMTVRDLQAYFGFEEPQAIYKWQRGKSLPTVDNLYALGALLDVPMEDILVPANAKSNMMMLEPEGFFYLHVGGNQPRSELMETCGWAFG